jgi:hypothetical protein
MKRVCNISYEQRDQWGDDRASYSLTSQPLPPLLTFDPELHWPDPISLPPEGNSTLPSDFWCYLCHLRCIALVIN